MEFGIRVKVAADGATSTIDGVTSSLDKLETKGKTAPAAATKGLKELNDAFKAATPAIAAMTKEEKAFEVMLAAGNAQLAQEKAMLDQILGPQQKHAQAVETIERLYAKGKISIDEWTDSITKANQALARTQPRSNAGLDSTTGQQFGPVFDPSKAGAGGPGFGSGGGSSGAGLAMAADVAAFAAVAASLDTLADGYALASNAAQRLVTSGKGVDAVLAEQLALSEKFHGSLQTTINLSAAIAVGTEHMNLTTRDRINLEKALAETVQNSGKSLDDAAALFKKVEFAAEQGSFGAKELKAIFKEYPAVSEQMQAGLGKSQDQILAMAKAGHFTADTFIQLELAQKNATDEKFANQIETTSQRWQHFKDELALSVGKLIEGSGAIDAFGSALHAIESVIGTVAGGIGKINDGLGKLPGGLHLGVGTVAGAVVAGPLGAAVGTLAQGFLESTALDKMPAFQAALAKIRAEEEATAKVTDDLVEKVQRGQVEFAKEAKLLGEVATVVKNANKVLADSVWKVISDNAHEALKRMAEDHKRAAEQAAAQWKALYEQATGGAAHFKSEVGMLDQMLNSNLITVVQYRNELQKLTDAWAGADVRKMLQGANGPKPPQPVQSGGFTLGEGDDAFTIETETRTPSFASQAAQHLAEQAEEIKAQIKLAADLRATATPDLNADLAGIDKITEAQKKAREMTRAWYDEMRKFKELSDPYKGLVNGLNEINHKVHDTAAEISKAMVSAFDSANDALAKMVTTGDTSWAQWSDVLKSIESDLVKIGLHRLEAGAIDAITSHGVSASDSALIAASMTTAGTTVSAEWFASISGAGAAAAAAMAGAIAGAGAVSGAEQAFAAVPHFANGGTFAGNGVDTMPFFAMVNPNERITVHSQQETARMQQAERSGGQPVQHFHYYDYGDPRGLAPMKQELRDLREMVMKARNDRNR